MQSTSDKLPDKMQSKFSSPLLNNAYEEPCLSATDTTADAETVIDLTVFLPQDNSQ